jgi:hypothetical protein
MSRIDTPTLLYLSVLAFLAHMVLGGFYIGFPPTLGEGIAYVVLVLAIVSLILAIWFYVLYVRRQKQQ